ncbi:MAG: arylesterase [Acidobacteriota bacterium]
MLIRTHARFGLSSLLLLAALGLSCLACGERQQPAQNSQATAQRPQPLPAPSAEPEEPLPLIIFLGDSLTAGYGLSEAQAFPALIEAQLNQEERRARVVNAGISGDTTAGGLDRLDWLLQQQPDILMVCLGANDGLRGLSLESSQANLRSIITRAQERDIRVLLAGMLIPPNYGQDYTDRFAAIYPTLAKELGVPLIPFLLEGVAARPELNLPDGIHPTAEGQEIIASTVMPFLVPLIEAVESSAPVTQNPTLG